MTKVDQRLQQFEAFMTELNAQLVRCGKVDQARFAESQREWWWLFWVASRDIMEITNPFPAQMGDPDADWAREVAEKSLRAQGLKVVG